MSARSIRILADDLTGALDTAAAFSGQVPVFIDRPPDPDQYAADAPVVALATGTRDIPPESLPARLQPALEWLRAGTIAFKKVDSLLRGNTFAETAWIAQHGHFDLTVFAPAFPAQGRITVDDRQRVVKPDGSRQSVATPLHEAFSGLGRHPCAALDGESGRACDTWIPEILTDSDLDRVVSTADGNASESCLWCGSAGLAHALARRWNLAPSSGPTRPLPGAEGPSVLISASFQPVLKEQWARLCAAPKTAVIARHADNDEIATALDQARTGANEIWLDLSPTETIPPEQAASLLAEQTARIVEQLPRPGQLMVVGGDTLLALCRASGATALMAHPAVKPGWGCARLVGGIWDGVPCYSRSGAFGGPEDLEEMTQLLCNG